MIEEYESFLGKPLEELEEALLNQNKTLRVVKCDEVHIICTRDVQLDRLNVELRDGYISMIRNFG